MYTHIIEQITREGDNYYFKSVVGTVTDSNQVYFLPIENKQVADDLAVRHGLRDIMNLTYFTFVSTHKAFDEAFEKLLFGKCSK